MYLKNIRITGLFGFINVDIAIQDNALILVGANGLGKSTVLNIIYLFLSKRWDQLAIKPFSEVTATFDNFSVSVARDELTAHPAFTAPPITSDYSFYRMQELPMSMSRLLSYPHELLEQLLHQKTYDRSVRTGLGVSPTEQRELFVFLHSATNKPIVDVLFGKTKIARTLKSLDQLLPYRLMFLPTYRRIERDLSAIFPDADDIMARYRMMQPRFYARRSVVEFVQFGMNDVKKLFESKQQELRAESHSSLSSTSGRYLQDVIRGRGTEYDPAQIISLDEDAIERTMRRYRAGPISPSDQRLLLQVTQVVRDGGELTENESLIAHYLIKLVEAMDEIAKHEAPVRHFVETVNSYLKNKRAVYDQDKFAISIVDETDRTVELRDLSSGEKQIVSLFAHVFLEAGESYIFIDEPEMSLSVDWQLRFLPDIRRSQGCRFLLAVTHSPFIFENELEQYTQDLRTAQTIGG